jgi:hypothetical protein
MRDAIVVLPYRNLALTEIHHGTATGADVVETMHDRLALAALVEFLRNFAIRIVDRCPCKLFAEDLLSNEDPRSRAVAYAPRVESGGNERFGA